MTWFPRSPPPTVVSGSRTRLYRLTMSGSVHDSVAVCSHNLNIDRHDRRSSATRRPRTDRKSPGRTRARPAECPARAPAQARADRRLLVAADLLLDLVGEVADLPLDVGARAVDLALTLEVLVVGQLPGRLLAAALRLVDPLAHDRLLPCRFRLPGADTP